MRLAVSNIGWTEAEDATILPRLRDAGVEAIEVAPGRIFADVPGATAAEAKAIGARYRDAGLPIVSMQALLFGRPELTLFGTAEEVQPLLDHLSHVIKLAGALGCGPLVFGSPRNRLKGERSFAAARDEAVPVLRRIGAMAEASGTVFCLEANAADYGCDFMTRLAEAGDVAAAAGHPGVGQVADTGNMIMMGEEPEAIRPVAPHVRHVHVSAPQLGPVADVVAFVERVMPVLRDVGYDSVVTVEMRPGDGDDPTSELFRAVDLLRGLIDRG